MRQGWKPVDGARMERTKLTSTRKRAKAHSAAMRDPRLHERRWLAPSRGGGRVREAAMSCSRDDRLSRLSMLSRLSRLSMLSWLSRLSMLSCGLISRHPRMQPKALARRPSSTGARRRKSETVIPLLLRTTNRPCVRHVRNNQKRPESAFLKFLKQSRFLMMAQDCSLSDVTTLCQRRPWSPRDTIRCAFRPG